MTAEENKKVLEGQDAIDLWLQGREKWNEWAKFNIGVTVSFRGIDFSALNMITKSTSVTARNIKTDFDSFVFPGPTIFNGAIFGGGVTFGKSRFVGASASFAGVQFGDGSVSFSGAIFLCNNVSFVKARFGQGDVYFTNVELNSAYVTFKKARFGKGLVFFNNAHFGERGVNFRKVIFESESVRFENTNFGKGEFCFSGVRFIGDTVDLRFDGSTLAGGDFDFHGITFPKGRVGFRKTKFSNGRILFKGTSFCDAEADFGGAEFTDVDVLFGGAIFSKANICFKRTNFGNGDISFEGVEFGQGDVDFQNSKFGDGLISFKKSKFGIGKINFENAEFGGGKGDFTNAEFVKSKWVSFKETKNKGAIDFEQAIFDSEKIDFSKSRFDASVSFARAKFYSVPDFTCSKFSHHVMVSDMEIVYPEENKFFKGIRLKYSDGTYAAKFRRLKELAINSKDRKLELEFFAEELIAMRNYEVRGGALALNYLYQLFSGFGRIVWLPLAWMLVSIFSFAGAFLLNSTKDTADYCSALLFSFSQSISFSSWAKKSNSIAESELFSDVSRAPDIVHYLAMAENAISILLLGLVVLALRNRFRL